MYDPLFMLKFCRFRMVVSSNFLHVEATLVTSGRAVSEHLDLTGSGLL